MAMRISIVETISLTHKYKARLKIKYGDEHSSLFTIKNNK